MSKIAFITDIHLDEQFTTDQGVDARKNLQWILNDLKSRNINEIIFGGDIGETSSNEWFFQSLKNFNLRLILGNHDTYDEAIKFYHPSSVTNNKKLFYAQEDAVFKYIFLDSSSKTVNATQLNWLIDQLKTEKKIILFIHHPILKVDTIADTLYPLKNRDEIKNILQAKHKHLVIFCGHYHMEHETREKNITQFITPASSYQIEKNAPELIINPRFFAYRIIQLEGEEITSEVIVKNKE